ncbi:MAG: gene transfer agent family protein [Rhodobacteraceae bacterium]|nr:gene transfer agent family protein [Paracoccaceae bacterium]
MVNPYRGEVALEVDGQEHVLRLTLGVLAELETDLGAGSLLALVERFETGAFSAGDLLALLAAGLKGGGWNGSIGDLASAEIAGGPVAAARAAARLLAVSFAIGDGEVGGDA